MYAINYPLRCASQRGLASLRIVILCLVSSSCDTTERDFEARLVNHSLSEKRALPTEVISAPSSERIAAPEIMGYPWTMMLWEDLLVITDAGGSPYVHAFDTTGKHVLSAGRFGQGPGDFASGPAISPDREDRTKVWLFDQLSNRLSRLRLDSLKQARFSIDTIVQGELGRTSRAATALSRDAFAFWGRANNKLLTIVSEQRESQTALGYNLSADSIPESEQFKAYSFKTCSPPRSARIAIAYFFTRRLDLVRFASAPQVVSASVPISFPPYVDRHALLSPG